MKNSKMRPLSDTVTRSRCDKPDRRLREEIRGRRLPVQAHAHRLLLHHLLDDRPRHAHVRGAAEAVAMARELYQPSS